MRYYNYLKDVAPDRVLTYCYGFLSRFVTRRAPVSIGDDAEINAHGAGDVLLVERPGIILDTVASSVTYDIISPTSSPSPSPPAPNRPLAPVPPYPDRIVICVHLQHPKWRTALAESGITTSYGALSDTAMRPLQGPLRIPITARHVLTTSRSAH